MSAQTYRTSKWDTFWSFAAAFSLLVSLTYIVLWRDSNRNWFLFGGSVLLFVISLVLSRNRLFVAGVACGFSGLRFVIAAVGSMSIQLAIIALVLLAIPVSIVAMKSLRESL